MNDGDIGIPEMLGRAGEIPTRITIGRWVIWAHKWADKDQITPDEWRRRTAAALEESGVLFEMRVLPDQDLTIIWNKLMPPTKDQLDNSIRAIKAKLDYERRQGR